MYAVVYNKDHIHHLLNESKIIFVIGWCIILVSPKKN